MGTISETMNAQYSHVFLIESIKLGKAEEISCPYLITHPRNILMYLAFNLKLLTSFLKRYLKRKKSGNDELYNIVIPLLKEEIELKINKVLVVVVAFGLLLTLTGCSLPITKQQEQSGMKFFQTVKDQITRIQDSFRKQDISSQEADSAVNTSRVQTTQSVQTTSKKIAKTSSSSIQAGSSSGKAPSKVIQTIKQHLQNHDAKFTVPASSLKTIEADFKEALALDPYIQWIVSSYNISSNGIVARMTVNYRESKDETEYVNTHVQQVLSSILKPGMTPVYKEFVIHNWLVRYLQYDTSLQNGTAFNALKTHRAVCQGYALLAYRMLNAAGIPTKIETGNAHGESHMWNEVYINGKWYQLDVTWDDPVGDGANDLSTTYFNVTNQELAQSHQWNENKFPIATTDFITQLKSLVKNDPHHSSQYKTILSTIGAYLPVAEKPETAHHLLQQALDANKHSIDFIIKATQANSTDFMNQADRHLVASRSVSIRYSAATYVRKGQDYCRVHVTFKS